MQRFGFRYKLFVIFVPAAFDVGDIHRVSHLRLGAGGGDIHGHRQVGEEKSGRVFATVIGAVTAGECPGCVFHIDTDAAAGKAAGNGDYRPLAQEEVTCNTFIGRVVCYGHFSQHI